MQTTIQFNPDDSFRSILRKSPASATDKVGACLILIGSNRTELAAGAGLEYHRLSKVLKGHIAGSEDRRRVSAALGLEVSDIWPEEHGQEAA